MQESDKNALIQELNKLSEWWPDTKERMICEIVVTLSIGCDAKIRKK